MKGKVVSKKSPVVQPVDADKDESMSDAPDFEEFEELAESNEDEAASAEDEDGELDEVDDNAADSDDDEDDEQLLEADPEVIATSAPLFAGTTPSSSSIQKAIPYTHDAGHLLILDNNPVPPSASESILASTARDAAQSLLDHLLTTCPIITRPSTSTSTSGVEMQLPPPVTLLPREKPVPKAKEPTKWDRFAQKKGIGKYAKPGQGKAGEAPRAGKMVYDEVKGEWVPKWGYKGKNKEGEGDWLVEIDDKKPTRNEGGSKAARVSSTNVVLGVDDPRGLKRAERKEAVRRNDRAQRANERKTRKGQGTV